MTNIVCESKSRLVVRSSMHSCVHAQETGWRSDMQSCILPRLPTHLVQELNVGTVYDRYHPAICWTKIDAMLLHKTELKWPLVLGLGSN